MSVGSTGDRRVNHTGISAWLCSLCRVAKRCGVPVVVVHFAPLRSTGDIPDRTRASGISFLVHEQRFSAHDPFELEDRGW